MSLKKIDGQNLAQYKIMTKPFYFQAQHYTMETAK